MAQNSDDSGPSATDVITYIGVPLAVLGVLPILYNTCRTLVTLSRVKRILRKSRIAGITRGDVINHVIEVELPRFTIAPLDRHDSEDYWKVYEYPSPLRGGTWTLFNWKVHTIGLKTQRIEYSDQLRQPQAEIGFEELISYLLDLGAVPSAAGFKMLRSNGLWTPTGTILLFSPLLEQNVLTIAPLDDSDGSLSLAVNWSREWQTRDRSALPPYWMLISGYPSDLESRPWLKEHLASCARETPTGVIKKGETLTDGESSTASVVTLRSARIRCQFSIEGLMDAMSEEDSLPGSQRLSISHLQITRTQPCTAGIWFASAATALGAASHGVLWNYHIPDVITVFAKKDTIPCGCLVLLSVVEESATPEWATVYDVELENLEATQRRMREVSEAMMREHRLDPAQRQVAIMDRLRKAGSDWQDEMRAKLRRDEQRSEQRIVEAIQSACWNNQLVAEHNLRWLQSNGYMNESFVLREAVESILYWMLYDTLFAADLVRIMDTWRAWVVNGGMRKSDYLDIKSKQALFSFASLLLSVIRGSVTAAEGSMAIDLQESVQMWKRVRLG